MHIANLQNLKIELTNFLKSIRNCDDSTADHLISVSHFGNINIDQIPIGKQWKQIVPQNRVLFHLPIRHAGNGCVGANADRYNMIESFMILVRAWQQKETGMVCAEETLTKKDYGMIKAALPNYP
ncbi:MAG: hypothetical protein Q8N96_01830 [Methylovulum sp.]|nr:hypothetical protein [Methylovulum sp.]